MTAGRDEGQQVTRADRRGHAIGQGVVIQHLGLHHLRIQHHIDQGFGRVCQTTDGLIRSGGAGLSCRCRGLLNTQPATGHLFYPSKTGSYNARPAVRPATPCFPRP